MVRAVRSSANPFWKDTAPLLAAGLVGIAILVLRSAVPFPLVNDHAYFLPASWWLAETGQLANPWLQPGFDKTLNWHGFLQPWLIGQMARPLGGGWEGVYLATNLLAAATIVAIACYARLLDLPAMSSLFLVAITAALMLDARSRPEVLTTLETASLVYLGFGLARRFPSGSRQGFGIGAVCAAILCTHPAVAILACLGVSAMLAVIVLERRPSPALLVRSLAAITAGFSITLVALLALVFGSDAALWLAGIAETSRLTLARTDTAGLVRYYLTNRFLPAFGILSVPLFAAVWLSLWPSATSRAPWLRRIVALLSAAAAGFLIYRLALRIPASYYNVTGVLVAVCILAAALHAGSRRRLVVDICLGAFAATSLAGISLWSAQSLADQPRIAPSRAALASAIEADRQAARRICADAAALAAIDSVETARSVAVSLRLSLEPADPDPAACDIYYALRAAGRTGAAPPAPGFVAEPTTSDAGWFSRAGLRPSHFGFTRWVSDR